MTGPVLWELLVLVAFAVVGALMLVLRLAAVWSWTRALVARRTRPETVDLLADQPPEVLAESGRRLALRVVR